MDEQVAGAILSLRLCHRQDKLLVLVKGTLRLDMADFTGAASTIATLVAALLVHTGATRSASRTRSRVGGGWRGHGGADHGPIDLTSDADDDDDDFEVNPAPQRAPARVNQYDLPNSAGPSNKEAAKSDRAKRDDDANIAGPSGRRPNQDDDADIAGPSRVRTDEEWAQAQGDRVMHSDNDSDYGLDSQDDFMQDYTDYEEVDNKKPRKRPREPKDELISNVPGKDVPDKVKNADNSDNTVAHSLLAKMVKDYEADPNVDELFIPHRISLSEEIGYDAEAYSNLDLSDCGTLKLKAEQIEHARKIMKIFMHSQFALDFSAMGSGKTLVACALARSFDCVIVVCPATVQRSWTDHIKKCNPSMSENQFIIISWQYLYNTKSMKKHGLLEQNGEVLAPTLQWSEAVQNSRTLVVLDEAHTFKNQNTVYHHCARALLRPLLEAGRSKVLLLSATICDRKEHAWTFMDTLGLFEAGPHGDLFPNALDKGNEWKAMDNLLDWSQGHGGHNQIELNSDQEYKTWCAEASRDPSKLADAGQCTDIIWRNVILPRFSVWMRQPHTEKTQVRVAGYFRMRAGEDRDELERVIADMEKASRDHAEAMKLKRRNQRNRQQEPQNEQQDFDEGNKPPNFQENMIALEVAKVPLLIHLACDILRRSQTAQVIISLRHTDSIKKVMDDADLKQICGEEIVELQGNVSPAERLVRIDKFNANDSKVRVVVGQAQVISTGINLDDRDGDRPRTILTTPTYFAIDLTQLMGRTLRVTTKSNSSFVIVFEKELEKDSKMIASMQSKALIMRDPVQQDLCRPFLYDLRKWDCDANELRAYHGTFPGVPPEHLLSTSALPRVYE